MSDRNLVNFSREFIVAGPRNSVVNIYNILKDMSITVLNPEQTRHLLHTKEQIVLLCINQGTSESVFGCIKVLSRQWWDLYHNKKKILTRNVLYDTYNARRQKGEILKFFNTKEIETLIPE